MKKTITIMLALLVWTQCGSSTSDSGDEATPTDDAANVDATGDALADSLGDTLGGAGGPGNLVKRQMSEDGMSDEGTSTSSQSYGCTLSDDQKSQTCDCPDGGSVTYSYDNAFTILQSGGTFNQTVSVVFDACSVPSCGGSKTMDGEVSGQVTGTISQSGFSATAEMATSGECSGLTVGDTKLGFSLSMTLDGTTETLAGEIAIAPDCQVITFDSWDDLMDDLDPDGACTE